MCHLCALGVPFHANLSATQCIWRCTNRVVRVRASVCLSHLVCRVPSKNAIPVLPIVLCMCFGSFKGAPIDDNKFGVRLLVVEHDKFPEGTTDFLSIPEHRMKIAMQTILRQPG